MTLSEHGLARVDFVEPVEGRDALDEGTFISNRHYVAATWARQDDQETVFVDDAGAVVARWATKLVLSIEWPASPSAGSATSSMVPSVGTTAWRHEVQAKYPKAYQRWSKDEEEQLRIEFAEGLTVDEMAQQHERRPGGIMSRLVRLGLAGPETRQDSIGRQAKDGALPPGGEVESTPRVEAAKTEPRQRRSLRERGRASTRPKRSRARQASGESETVDTCRHEIFPASACDVCRMDGRASVFITGGGVHFHRRRDCWALRKGQGQVERRGGRAEEIESVIRGSARLEGRDPCSVCRPD